MGGKVRNIVCNACNAGRYVGGKVGNVGGKVGNVGDKVSNAGVNAGNAGV